jgi:peptidoglycan-associated lipoprotein
MKKLVLVIAALVVAAGCSSKKKVEDQQAITNQNIDSSPLGFDAAGSDSGKIAGLVTIHFEYDKSNLTAEAKKDLEGNAAWIKANGKSTVQIEGHCDERGTIEYNLALGERRAQAVKSYLVGLGVPADRMSVISYGEEKPLVSGSGDEAWSKNRRANFLPISK